MRTTPDAAPDELLATKGPAMPPAPLIRLWHLATAGLILLHPSGVCYSNQTGGVSCRQPVVEGSLVPLHVFLEPADALFAACLDAYFTGPKWGGACDEGIDRETADWLDALCQQSSLTTRLSVNRQRLAESMEAWIYMTIAPDSAEDPSYALFSGFPGTEGVLTWENSD